MVPHLSDPYLQHILDIHLAEFVEESQPWRKYVAGSPPWIWTQLDYHYDKAAERAEQSGHMDKLPHEFGFSCMEMLHKAIEDDEELQERVHARITEIDAPFLPQPDGVAFYQVYGACHWMAPFFTQLARRVVPDLIWTTLFGRYHSTTIGRRSTRGPGSRKVVMVFDPLRSYQPAVETVRAARMK